MMKHATEPVLGIGDFNAALQSNPMRALDIASDILHEASSETGAGPLRDGLRREAVHVARHLYTTILSGDSDLALQAAYYAVAHHRSTASGFERRTRPADLSDEATIRFRNALLYLLERANVRSFIDVEAQVLDVGDDYATVRVDVANSTMLWFEIGGHVVKLSGEPSEAAASTLEIGCPVAKERLEMRLCGPVRDGDLLNGTATFAVAPDKFDDGALPVVVTSADFSVVRRVDVHGVFLLNPDLDDELRRIAERSDAEGVHLVVSTDTDWEDLRTRWSKPADEI